MTTEEKIEKLEQLCSKDSFRGDDINKLVILFNTYANPSRARKYCMSCPGSVSKLVRDFKNVKHIILKKLEKELEDEKERKNNNNEGNELQDKEIDSKKD